MQTASLPPSVEKYGQSPLFDEHTVPGKLTAVHNTKAGVWGLLRVVTGQLEFVECETAETPTSLNAGDSIVIVPQRDHFVRIAGPVEFQIDFYR